MTKMGVYISLEMQTPEVGSKVKKNQIIAHTKNFSKDGIYSSGTNAFMAVMQYMGMGHEDSYVINERMANKMTRDIVKELFVIIPPETKIINIEKEVGKTVTKNDVLVEFSYHADINEYLEINQIEGFDDEEELLNTYVQGTQTIKKMAQDGEIVDIKLFVNNKNSVDKQVIQYHKQLVKETREIIDKLSANAVSKEDQLKAVDNISLKFTKYGGHKLKGGVEFLGAKLVYYIKQKEPLQIGDKLATRYGAKGVIGYIIPEGEEPKPEFSPRIDKFISPVGVFSRKNISMIKELYLGKIIYFLNEKIKELAEKEDNNEKIKDLILDVYSALNISEVYESVKKTLDDSTPDQIRKRIKSGKFKVYFTAIPFKHIDFEDIQNAADILGIPLDEKIYIPETKTWTKTPVPVGVTYSQVLEQTAEIYSNIRSAGKYQGLTQQATKGKSREGGQTIGQLDVNALLTYNVPAFLSELLTVRSDDHKSKRRVVNQIIANGSANIPRVVGGGGTVNLMNVFMTGMGLKIT